MTEITPGTRLRSAVCTAEVVVTNGGKGVLTCGGAPMLSGAHGPGGGPRNGSAAEDRTLLGKRYQAPRGNLQVLCLRQGRGALALDGVPLELLKPKTLPASD